MLGPHDPLLVCRVWGVVVNNLALGHLPTWVTVQRAGVGAAAAFAVSQTMVRSPRCVPARAPHVALRPARGRVAPVS